MVSEPFPEIPPEDLPILRNLPWWRKLLGKHAGQDTLPPPTGWPSWSAYALAIGVNMHTWLPLGPTDITKAEGVKMTAVWTRDGEDVATVGAAFVHADGSSTVPVVDADCNTIATAFTTLWNALKAKYTSSIQLDRYEFHDIGVGVRRPNPRRLETILSPAIAGTADPTIELPPQVALSVTFKTHGRRNWGRVFLPAPRTDECVSGRILASTVADVRTAFGTFADAVAAANLPMVIWSPRHAGAELKYGAANHAANLDEPDDTSFAKSVDTIQVDDLWDVVRSRRFSAATVRETHSLP